MTEASQLRVPLVDPDNLTPEQQPVADRISGTRGRLPGPFTALLQLPELADRVQSLGAYLRYEGILDRDVAETAILVTAVRWGSAFEWDAHEPHALRAGVPESVLADIRAGTDASAMPDRLRVVRAYAHELASQGRVSDEAFDAAAAHLGSEGMIELTALVGYYSMVALTLNAVGWD